MQWCIKYKEVIKMSGMVNVAQTTNATQVPAVPAGVTNVAKADTTKQTPGATNAATVKPFLTEHELRKYQQVCQFLASKKEFHYLLVDFVLAVKKAEKKFSTGSRDARSVGNLTDIVTGVVLNSSLRFSQYDNPDAVRFWHLIFPELARKALQNQMANYQK
jgi:hypothetical protein